MHECIRELQADVILTSFVSTHLQWKPYCPLGTKPGSFVSYLLEVSPSYSTVLGGQYRRGTAGLEQLLWRANVTMILMTLLIYLVDGIQNVMRIHLSSSHYLSAVYCQGNKQSVANISFCCSVQFASAVCLIVPNNNKSPQNRCVN